jgi:hypothetical protein
MRTVLRHGAPVTYESIDVTATRESAQMTSVPIPAAMSDRGFSVVAAWPASAWYTTNPHTHAPRYWPQLKTAFTGARRTTMLPATDASTASPNIWGAESVSSMGTNRTSSSVSDSTDPPKASSRLGTACEAT